VLAGSEIAPLNAAPEGLFFVGGKEGDLVDLPQIGFETTFGRNGTAPGPGGELGLRRGEGVNPSGLFASSYSRPFL
jgi:hypothetical protein